MRIDHILFPVDFSDHSRMLNPEVEWLASHFHSRVTLLHVFEIPTSWYGGAEGPLITSDDILAYAESERQGLKDYALQLPEDRIQRISAEGGAAWHIAKWAGEHDVDLIVMGTHGYGPLRRLLLGSVAMKVLHDVHCPVWTHSLHRDSETRQSRISNIVCALELTEEAIPLLRFTNDLATDFGAQVHLVHTVPNTVSGTYRSFDMGFHRHLMNLAEEEIRGLQDQAGTGFSLTLTENSIAQDTAKVALDKRADLIVIGRGIAQATFGTLRTHAYDIIRQATCPVLSYSMDRQRPSSSIADREKCTEPVVPQ
jgi:nucleotide-binding universal stress UspA family protein